MKFRLCTLCALVLLTHCASKDQPLKPVEGSEKTKDGPTYLVGIIDFVNPDQKFVLFKAQPGISLPPGHTLTALDATGALSELVVTPERKDSHVTADIKSGQPRAGNLVVYFPSRQVTTPAAPGVPPTSPAAGPVTAPPGSTGFPAPPGLGGQAEVEWRDGQPPPLPASGSPLRPQSGGMPPASPSSADAPIPLTPLPEEPSAALPPPVGPR